MKTIENVTLYACDHCGKKYQRQHACQNHEQWCSKNSNNKHQCFNCVHLSKEQEWGNQSPDDTEPRGKVHFYCDSEQCSSNLLYSFKAEKIKHDDVLIGDRMPLVCAHFVDQLEDLI